MRARHGHHRIGEPNNNTSTSNKTDSKPFDAQCTKHNVYVYVCLCPRTNNKQQQQQQQQTGDDEKPK